MKYEMAQNVVAGYSIVDAAEQAGFSRRTAYYQYHKIKHIIDKLEARVIKQSSRSLIAAREEAYQVLSDVMRKAENQSDRTRAAKALLDATSKDKELNLRYTDSESSEDSKASNINIYLPERNEES